MAYIGAEPVPGQNREVDDISSSFNGSTTAFTLQVSGVNVSPESANNILVNLGGVLQNPGTDYTIAASTITFTTAPASGLSFFALVLGAGINTATVADDTIGASKLIDTAVTAGSYTTADITVDAQGRITAAANGTIAEAEIANNAVTTNKIADEAVTLAKLPHGTSSNDGKFLRANNGADPSFETVTSTTINNNADNRVITGSGTANTLNGEANLTYTSQSSLNLTDGNGTSVLGGNYLLLKRSTGDANYINAPLADANLILSADENLLFHTVHTADFNSTERMRIDSSGRIIQRYSAAPYADRALTLQSPSGQTTTALAIVNTETNGQSNIVFGDHVGQDAGNFTGFISYNHQDNDMRFGTNGGNERIRIDSSGRLLVGTTSYKSNLNASADSSGQISQFVHAGDNINGCLSVFAYSGSTSPTTRGAKLQLHRARSSDGSTNTTLSTNDLIGAIEFKGNDGSNFTQAAKIEAFVDGGTGADDMPGRLGFSTTADGSSSSTERMRIYKTGVVQIMSEKLTMGTSVTNGGVSDGNFCVEFPGNSKNAIKTRDIDNNSTVVHMVFCSGSAAVGTITGTTGQAFYNNLSDYRSKENDVKITDGIEKIKLLRPIRFNYKVDKDTLCDGFFAHEVAAAVPTAVTGEKDGMAKIRYEEGDTIPDGKKIGDIKEYSTTEIDPQMLDTGKIIPLLTAALQEAITKIETLETKVAALEAA